MNKLEQLKARKADLGREIESIRADRDYSEEAKARRSAPPNRAQYRRCALSADRQ